MNERAALIAVALALFATVIAGVILFVPKRSGVDRPAGADATYDLGTARAIEVTRSGQTPERVVRSGPVWYVEWDEGTRWPSEQSNVRAALRLLAEMREQGEGRPAPESGPSLRIELDDDRALSLRFDEQPLGGRINATVVREGADGSVEHVLVQEDVFNAFCKSGLLPWRTRSVFPFGLDPARRIELMTGTDTLALDIGGRTPAIVKPVRAAAGMEQVSGLMAQLSRLQIERFTDTDPRELGPPLGMIVASGPGSKAGSEVRQELVVWVPDGVTDALPAEVRIVSVEGETQRVLAGPLAIELSGRALESISMGASSYVGTCAVALPPSEIGAVVLIGAPGATPPPSPDDAPPGAHVVKRTLDGWESNGDDDGSWATRLIALACEIDASDVSLGLPSEADATLVLYSLLGEPVASITLTTSDADTLSMSRDGVIWTYRRPGLIEQIAIPD